MRVLKGEEQATMTERVENNEQQPRKKSKVKRENSFAWFVFPQLFPVVAHFDFRWGCDKVVKRHPSRPPPTVLSASCDRIVEYRVDNVSVICRLSSCRVND